MQTEYKITVLEDVDFEEDAKEQALESYPNGKVINAELA
jgi:hypothetical protein